ncbi:MAG: alpha/beta fold hydrolase [Gemmatimonadaceae bacterium]
MALATGVRLHYVERGNGTPVVFIHGGGRDYRYWDAHLEWFARRYRAVAYSRRYAPPNANPAIRPDYAANIDAADLAALLQQLRLGPAHLVGASIGGVAALFLAVEHPELVRSLVLAEPPVLRWALDVPGGAALFEQFFNGAFRPAGEAFGAGQPERGMELLTDAFLGPGTFARFPEALKRKVMRAAPDWAAQTMSTAAFPDLSRDAVRAITAPVLMLSGARTIPLHALVDDELQRVLPRARRVVIPEATHDLWADQPERCRELALAFLAEQ